MPSINIYGGSITYSHVHFFTFSVFKSISRNIYFSYFISNWWSFLQNLRIQKLVPIFFFLLLSVPHQKFRSHSITINSGWHTIPYKKSIIMIKSNWFHDSNIKSVIQIIILSFFFQEFSTDSYLQFGYIYFTFFFLSFSITNYYSH